MLRTITPGYENPDSRKSYIQKFAVNIERKKCIPFMHICMCTTSHHYLYQLIYSTSNSLLHVLKVFKRIPPIII